MEILSDRIGVILKYGKLMGSLTKRYFFVDNKGVLYYQEKENLILELLKSTNYDNDKFVSLLRPISKTIQLNDCSISGVKTYLENRHDLKGRSYFELFVRSREYRSILLFSWKEEYINSLHEYLENFRELNVESLNSEHLFFENGEISSYTSSHRYNPEPNIKYPRLEESDDSKSNNSYIKERKYMEGILMKLNGKLDNQFGWEREFIKVINPTSQLSEYEEVWVQLDNGSNYSGPVKNQMPHGYGKEYRPDGSLYTGYFFNGKWQGPGTLTNQNLDSYQGEFIDGCVCGI